MRNMDEEDSITCLFTMHQHIAVGTLTGRVYFVDTETNVVLHSYQSHRSKITQLYFKDDKAVLSSSVEGTVAINFLNNDEFADIYIDSESNDEMTCFCIKSF